MDLVSQNLLLTSGGGKEDPTYVEDVFSTYLYTGTSANQTISNGIKLGNANGGNSVHFYDGNIGDYLQIAHTTDLCFGSGDFTIECWAYHEGDFDSFDALFGNWGSAGSFGYVLETVGSGATTDLEFYYYNDSNTFVGPIQGGTVSKNQWNHLCVCRNGNTIRLFVNGTMYGSGTSITTGIRDGSTEFTIGGQVAGAGWWNGYISNLRVTKGQALYTSNFTPSTQALTTTSQGATASNVKLLCCNKDTLTGATVTPSPIISDANYNGIPSNPIHSGFGPFTATDGEGGMVWIKNRDDSFNHTLFDTERGTAKIIRSSTNGAETSGSQTLTAFNNNGFSLGTDSMVNSNNDDTASWTFRKAKGFFDIVTYTGNDTNRTIAHSLGCVPGMILIKGLDAGHHWQVYHRDVGNTKVLKLNDNDAASTSGTAWNNTSPTATHFSLGTEGGLNTNNQEFVAYLFAGGSSTATGASSCSFNGTSGLDVAASSAVNFGTGTFCVEAWVYVDNLPGSGSPSYGRVFQLDGPTGNNSFSNFQITINPSNNTLHAWAYGGGNPVAIVGSKSLKQGQWNHIAVNRDSNNLITQYVNGIPDGTVTAATNFNPNSGSPRMRIGYYSSGNGIFDGKISNLRVTVGEPVYTGGFKPSTEPLTTTSQVTSSSNVKLLCCNVISNATGSTVTPGAIDNNGTNPVAYGNNPFDDPEGFKFGEEGDQNIIKCGSITTDSSNGATLHLPWEPQWFLFKRSDYSSNWTILDSMRGWTTDGTVKNVYPNLNNAESGGGGYEELKSRTIKFQGYGNNYDFIYMAIRRSDGLVGKPVEAGNDVFGFSYGTGTGTNPTFAPDIIPVDFTFLRRPGTSENWTTAARLIQGKYLHLNKTDAENNDSNIVFDYNNGFHNGSGFNSYLSWSWKRHAGFDVVTYDGQGGTSYIPHNLAKTPEMIWVKRRNTTENWLVYHNGFNGGTNPENYWMMLNTTSGNTYGFVWGQTAPTSTVFTVSDGAWVNGSGSEYIAMLFASVEGISKCGYYTGNASSSGPTITLGFAPRFILIKSTAGATNWFVYDTARGLTSGNDARIYLDLTNAETTTADDVDPTATGFQIVTTWDQLNGNNTNYIYYAHA